MLFVPFSPATCLRPQIDPRLPSKGSSTKSGDERPERPFATEGWEGDADVSDWEPFRLLGRSMVDYIADYYQGIESRPVKSNVEPGYLKVGGGPRRLYAQSTGCGRSKVLRSCPFPTFHGAGNRVLYLPSLDGTFMWSQRAVLDSPAPLVPGVHSSQRTASFRQPTEELPG